MLYIAKYSFQLGERQVKRGETLKLDAIAAQKLLAADMVGKSEATTKAGTTAKSLLSQVEGASPKQTVKRSRNGKKKSQKAEK